MLLNALNDFYQFVIRYPTFGFPSAEISFPKTDSSENIYSLLLFLAVAQLIFLFEEELIFE
jgi:hypothetical protein